jgi:hypothetical protein
MKVKTNLKAGNVISSASQQAKQVFRATGDFVGQGNQQVKNLASYLSARAGGLWNSLVG